METSKRTETRQERTETRKFFTDSTNEEDVPFPSFLNKGDGKDPFESFISKNTMDNFFANRNQDEKPSFNLNVPIQNGSPSINKTQQNGTSNTRSNTSPLSTRLVQDAFNNRKQKQANAGNTSNNSDSKTDTSSSLEESLNSIVMKPCKLEDIWKVEGTRYTKLIPVGGQYRPEDVKISMKDLVMTVLVQKEKFSQLDGSSLGFEGFGKSFGVPDDADFDGIKSTFTADGNLKIEVPKKK